MKRLVYRLASRAADKLVDGALMLGAMAAAPFIFVKVALESKHEAEAERIVREQLVRLAAERRAAARADAAKVIRGGGR